MEAESQQQDEDGGEGGAGGGGGGMMVPLLDLAGTTDDPWDHL